jgi:hypothetical protein
VVLTRQAVAVLSFAVGAAVLVATFIAIRRIMRYSLEYHDRLFKGPMLFGRPLPYSFKALYLEQVPESLVLPVMFFRLFYGVLTLIVVVGLTWLVVSLVSEFL